jgi:hypothetical protein
MSIRKELEVYLHELDRQIGRYERERNKAADIENGMEYAVRSEVIFQLTMVQFKIRSLLKMTDKMVSH